MDRNISPDSRPAKISVVIPLYNKADYIEATIDSVLTQSFADFEIVVVDDGSLDDGPTRVNRIPDARIRLFRKENQGVSSARNFGIRQAAGEYIFFLDADDTIKPDCLEEFASLTQEFPDAAFYTANFSARHPDAGERIICHKKDKGYIDHPYRDLFKRNIFPRTGAMLVRKNCFDQAGFFLEQLCKYEDLELNIRLLDKFRVAYTPTVVMVYNLSSSNLSTGSIAVEKEFASIIDLKTPDYYKKLILAENLVVTMELKLLCQKKYKEVLYLLKKNSLYMIILIYVYLILKVKAFKRVMGGK